MSQMTEVKKSTRWLALAAVTGAFAFTFISRYAWSPLMADVSKEFSLSATQAGLYMSAFFAGYLITQIPGGIMADKLQPKIILIICTALGGITTAMMFLIPGYELGLLLRIVTGVSSGCVMASCSKVVAVNFKGPERASAMGILLASPPLGITIANMVGAPLNAAFGWRKTFLFVSLIAIVVIVMITLFVKTIQNTTDTSNNKKVGMLEGLKVYFSDKEQLLLGIGGFMFMFVSVGFATWTNVYVQNTLGLSPAEGGMIITCYSLAGIAGSSFSGTIAKKLGMSHRSFLILSLSAMGVMTLLFSFQTAHIALIGVGIVYGAVSYLPSTHFTTQAMKRAGEQHSATAASTQNLIFQTSSMVQPVIIGEVIDRTSNYNLIWYIFLGCAVLSVFFCFLTSKE